MTAFVVPHRTTQTSAEIWVAWWARAERPPLVLRVRVDGGEQIARIALDSGWSEIGLDGVGQDEAACRYQVVALEDLTPATTYELALLPAEDDRLDSTNFHARGWVETLPDRLQSDDIDDLAQRPFTMLLGSCYSAPDDPDHTMSEAYRRLWDEGGRRPHLKVLCGDQVYLDQPAGPPMSDRKSSEELRRWMISEVPRGVEEPEGHAAARRQLPDQRRPRVLERLPGASGVLGVAGVARIRPVPPGLGGRGGGAFQGDPAGRRRDPPGHRLGALDLRGRHPHQPQPRQRAVHGGRRLRGPAGLAGRPAPARRPRAGPTARHARGRTASSARSVASSPTTTCRGTGSTTSWPAPCGRAGTTSSCCAATSTSGASPASSTRAATWSPSSSTRSCRRG